MYVMNEKVKRGKTLVIVIICIIVGISLFNFIGSIIALKYTAFGDAVSKGIGYGQVARQIIDLIINIVIAYFLYKGRNWVRVLSGVLLILSSLTFAARILEVVIASVPFSFFITGMAILFIITLAAGISLFVSKDIKSFIEFQSKK